MKLMMHKLLYCYIATLLKNNVTISERKRAKQFNNITIRPGFSLLLGIIVIAALLIFSSTQFDRVKNFVKFGSDKVMEQQAINLAEAGVDYSVWKLNTTAGNFYGTGSEIGVGTTGTFFVTVADSGPNSKTIQSTGYVPNSAKPRSKAAIKVQSAINNQVIAFNYAVQVGVGGLTMQNSSSISGNVYSNGNITGSGTTLIDGDAYAVGTISSPQPQVTRSKHPGASPMPMPTLDYNYWKKAACNNDPGYPGTCSTQQTCSPTCTLSTSQHIGPKKYAGNLTLSNNALITMDGPIWVTGNFTITGNETQFSLNDNFGSAGTLIIVNGKVTVNQGKITPNSASPPGYILVASTSTADDAITLGTSQGETGIFYALDGGIILTSNINVNAIASKSLLMQSQAQLQYKSGLASAQFSTGPGGSWVIKKGSYRYTK